MAATGFVLIMIIMFFASFILTVPSIIGLIGCKAYRKKKGKKANLIIRILLIIILLAGSIMFIIPTAFGGMLMYDNHKQSQYNLTLEAAAKHGDSSRVKQLLDSGTNPDQNTGTNYTPLTHMCTGAGNYDIAKILIEHKATVDIEFKGYSNGKEKGYTPLMYAVSNDQKYDIVKLLIDNKANVNHKASSDGYTPLIAAVNFERYTIVDLLIKNGADVNAADNKGKTVLEYACNQNVEYASYTIIKNLLEHGALVNTKTTNLEKLLTLVKEHNVNASDINTDYYNKIISILNQYSSK
ncbi:ankyrin repeat domain-containing protein [Clostridium pasteurianum]|uniref:ankyrin repeat domain-containing protein n=1 Tax=Clostridium pasteurianum TaxID=1501 RepID=UPI002260EA68|nr:ankyrin repeat domain-containing protein [Clostridium pasteurianum]UZW12681.1 ankyrin repeat domain-containing protein [Clostridium pasteurianum]